MVDTGDYVTWRVRRRFEYVCMTNVTLAFGGLAQINNDHFVSVSLMWNCISSISDQQINFFYD